jgi:hypothetical protein
MDIRSISSIICDERADSFGLRASPLLKSDFRYQMRARAEHSSRNIKQVYGYDEVRIEKWLSGELGVNQTFLKDLKCPRTSAMQRL